MLAEINDYFLAEKQESLLFIFVGLVAIGVAVWLWSEDHRLRSAAYPLVVVALIQLVVGGTVFLRTDVQRATLQQQFTEAPQQFKHDETVRMDVVMKNFHTYKLIEAGLLAVGLALIFFAAGSNVAWGIGAGLIIQPAFMMFLDLFAETRGEAYLQALRALPG